MTKDEEAQLLRETHENNIMLRSIVKYLNAQIATKEFSKQLMKVIEKYDNNLKKRVK